MNVASSKPFYLRPPWNVLFDFRELEKVEPWGVDVAFLLASFLEEMEKQEMDFRASGIALDSSAFIYLMKAELLLKQPEPVRMERPSTQQKPVEGLSLPPLPFPLRHEIMPTTVEQLLRKLEEALSVERSLPLKARPELVLRPSDILPQADRHLMEVERQMEGLYESLLRRLVVGRAIAFSRLVAGLERLEAIRIFILLLFLAQRGKVILRQEGDLEEVHVEIAERPSR